VIKDKARLHTFLRETSINNFLTLLFCIHVFLLLFMQPDQIGVILTLLKLGTASVVLIGPTETFFVPGFSEGLQCFACCTRIVKQKATICYGRKSAFGDGKESQHKFLVYTKF
jgi:hypothetical protein